MIQCRMLVNLYLYSILYLASCNLTYMLPVVYYHKLDITLKPLFIQLREFICHQYIFCTYRNNVINSVNSMKPVINSHY